MYLTQSLHRAAQQTPDLPASIFGERVRTYAEQLGRVSRLAGALRSLGVADGARVAILSLNSDRYLELLLAVPWAGGVLVPVNTRWSLAEIRYSLDDSAAGLLFVDDAFAAMVPALRDGRPGLRVAPMGDRPVPEAVFAYEDLVAGADPVPDVRRGGDSLAGILRPGASVTEAELREHTKSLIAGYKAPEASPSSTPCPSPVPARSSNESCACPTRTAPPK